MASNSCRQKARAALKCKFPPCPCEKCESDRETGKPEREQCGTGCEDETNGKDGERNFLSFISETIGIIAFLIIATTMFWLAVSQYMLYFGCKIYNSGRNTQLIAIAIIGLLFLAITGEFVIKKLRAKCDSKKTSTCPYVAKTKAAKAAATAAAAAKATKKADPFILPPSKVSCCAKKEPGIVPKNVTITITDSEAKEIFRQSRMYAIPIEMKQPPALLVYLRDVILRNF